MLCALGTCACRTSLERISTAEYYDRFSHAPHDVKLLVLGGDALRERVRLIRSAQESIELQTFIWTADECGQLIFLELARAAERGVRVRLMCDYLFTVDDPLIMAAATRVPGLEMRLYNPVANSVKPDSLALMRSGFFDMADLNQRMHNKLMVVDGKVALCGGRNIENTYYHESPAMNFKDLEILVRGPVVANMRASFEEFWRSELAKDVNQFKDVQKSIAEGTYKEKNIRRIEENELFARMERALADSTLAARDRQGYTTVRNIAFFSDRPGKNGKERSLRGSSYLNEVLIYSALRAKSNIWIQSPYVILSDRGRAVFRTIRKRNPELDIRISSNSMAATDNWAAYAFLDKNKRFLIEFLGVRLYEFNPLPADLYDYFPNYNEQLRKRTGKHSLDENMIRTVSPRQHPFLCVHAKCMLIDDHLSFIGTYNLDPRSAHLNTEISIVIDDKNFAINSTGRALTSLDLWPYQNCSCYTLREGAQPVAPGHKDFFRNYKSVGPFPRMPLLSDKEIYTRLLKAVGRFAQPIL
jgi:phosphatidylserine/phosphatidylglycerophosphate/cardiolipin synthase-like enzyme